MSKALRTQISAAVLSVMLVSAAQAAGSTKDVVLDRIAAPTIESQSVVPVDAMVVSVLLESPDGSLTPKSTNTLFRTGDKFRIKLLASRAAKVSLYNTNPRGETNPKPIWQGEVRVGLETISPRLALAGTSGIDQLHIVMEPAQERNIFGWLGSWINASKGNASSAKDIQLDVQHAPSTTYLLNPRGQGLVNTLQFVHSAN